MGADYSFEVKNIEIWVPAFCKHTDSSVATVGRPPIFIFSFLLQAVPKFWHRKVSWRRSRAFPTRPKMQATSEGHFKYFSFLFYFLLALCSMMIHYIMVMIISQYEDCKERFRSSLQCTHPCPRWVISTSWIWISWSLFVTYEWAYVIPLD